MADMRSATHLRKVLKRIITKEINKLRPEIRPGRVWSVEVGTQTAEILFPGNTNLVRVHFGLDKVPTSTILGNLPDGTDISSGDYAAIAGTTDSDIVRVAGKPNDWWIIDFIKGSPVKVDTVFDDGGSGSGNDEGYQDSFTVLDPTVKSFNLTYRPRPGSTVHMWWNNLPQLDDTWTIDGWTVTVDDPDNRIQSGDTFFFKYLIQDTALRSADPATLALVGSGHVNGTTSSIDLPAGTQAGDLIVVTACQRLYTPQLSTTDTRMDFIQADEHHGSNPTANGFIAWGYEDGSGDPIGIFNAGSGAWTEIATFRMTGQTHDRGFTPFHPRGSGGGSPTMPSPEDAMGIVVLMGIFDIVGDRIHADSLGNWTSISDGVDSNETTFISYCLTGTPAGTWTGMGATAEWAWQVIGITEGV